MIKERLITSRKMAQPYLEKDEAGGTGQVEEEVLLLGGIGGNNLTERGQKGSFQSKTR